MSLKTVAALAALLLLLVPSHAAAETTRECALDAPPQYVKSRGHSSRISVEMAGNERGQHIVLIPGLSTPRAVWHDSVMQLGGCYRLHLVQVKGFGDAPEANMEGPLLDAIATHIADYVDDAIFDEGGGRASIIGHSFGGLMAMKISLMIPEKLNGIMIVDSLPFFGAFYGPMVTAENIEPQASATRTALQIKANGSADARTLQMMSITQEGRAQVAKWSETANAKVAGQIVYEVMTTDMRRELTRIKLPLTMLFPIDKNSPIPPDALIAIYRQNYAGVPHAKLKRIEDSRHFIMLDRPAEFFKAVEEFLAEIYSKE